MSLKPLVTIRSVLLSDLPVFFQHQQDSQANHMAAFTAPNPADLSAFNAHWQSIMNDPTVITRTILADNHVAGNMVSFVTLGEREVGYWLGREFWGRGVATAALTAFLHQLTTRPLYARAASDNHASIRVLEKCGFIRIGTSTAFAEARGMEIEEVIMQLAAPST